MKSFPYYYAEYTARNQPIESLNSNNCSHRGDIASPKILAVGDILMIAGDVKQLKVVKVTHYIRLLDNTSIKEDDNGRQIIGEVFVQFTN